MVFVKGREVNVLSEVEIRQKRQKLRGKVISRIIKVDVEITGDNEFVRCGCSDGKN